MALFYSKFSVLLNPAWVLESVALVGGWLWFYAEKFYEVSL